MAEEKTRAQLLDEALRHEERNKYPSSRKYKADNYDKVYGDRKFDGVEIGPGTRVICRVYGQGKNDSLGYALFSVLDFQENGSYWGRDSEFIAEVLQVSNPALQSLVGGLRCISVEGHGYWNRKRYGIVEIGKENWKKFIPSGLSK